MPDFDRLTPSRAVEKLRTRVRRRGFDLARRLDDRYLLRLDYPPSVVLEPRYGHGAPPRRLLADRLATHDLDFADTLATLAAFRDDYARIALRNPDPSEPSWINDWFPGLDGVSLYGLVRAAQPHRYVEIGSGMSTLFAARACRDGDLARTRLRSIDPHPRRSVDALCDEVIRQPLEIAGLKPFEDIESGDVIFFDGSHRVFMNSDVTCFFLDVLPRLPGGVYVGIHDVYLPDDYPPNLGDRYYSEQYMLALILVFGTKLQPILPCWYVHASGHFSAAEQHLWADVRLADVPRHGASFWLRTA